MTFYVDLVTEQIDRSHSAGGVFQGEYQFEFSRYHIQYRQRSHGFGWRPLNRGLRGGTWADFGPVCTRTCDAAGSNRP